MASRSKKLNPVTTRYEFMGPIGAGVLAVALPCGVLGLSILCSGWSCSLLRLPYWLRPRDFFYKYGFPVVMVWFAFHMFLHMAPLGKTVKGTELRDGSRLSYRLNAIHAYVVSHVLFIVAYFVLGVRVSVVYDRFLGFASAAILFAFIVSFYLYARSFREGALLATGGNSGNSVYDWFMGRELNPRVGSFDLKVFCELRPGLIGWVLINYCMAAKQYENFGTVTTSMILVCAFQSWYVLDALWFEEAILTTMDVVHDGFGFMLAFGDLVWVPFTYSLQARFLVDRPTFLPWYVAVGICALNILGYIIFRCSNSQKDTYRRDPNHESVLHLFTLHTDRGTRLIISGWWGICRHPNYVGDLIMALSWSLPCGVSYLLPYFYPFYFAVLLVHRQLRDEEQCRQKYGKDWDRFCKIVPWRLIPYIY